MFGFLSFAGFEAAATLGEETNHPNRDIPRAILGVAILGGIYFFVVTAVEVMGFGTSAAGVKAFISSTSLIGDLGTAYVSSWIGNIITAGAMVSAFGCALACTVGSSRLIFAMGRDGILHGRLSQVSPGRRTPVTSTGAVVLTAYVIIAFTWFILGGRPVHAIRPGRNDRDADPARGVYPGHDRNGPAGFLHRADGGAPLGDRDPRRRHHRARLHPVPERLAVAYRGGLVGAVGGDLLDRDRADLGAGPPCRYPAGWSGPGGMCRSNQEMARVRKSMLAG